ncbi:MAG: lysophospholipid acyltransferase family protein [Syntrophales bacterium]|nr:lysophospholipid acyltransferase family protein [Syntrophales bacterium]
MTDDGMRAIFPAFLKPVADFTITVILWTYYVVGFLVFFFPCYLYAFFFSTRREDVFQKLNWLLHRSFFSLLRTIVPKVKWRIAEEVSAIRSSIIVANHLSFLDPILFVSLFEKQKTIVKGGYFRVPVFGWVLKTSAYISSQGEGLFREDMINRIENLKDYLSAGGNLFVFPEGTRSRNGRIGPFDKGAFSIARICHAPIKVVLIRNTHKLYPPGSFSFNTCDENVIEVELAGSLEPDYESGAFPLSGLMAEALSLMEGKMKR